MKALLQVLSLSTLILFASCAHHRSCCGNSSQCEMHKDGKDHKCCDKDQCPMKDNDHSDEHSKDHAEAKK